MAATAGLKHYSISQIVPGVSDPVLKQTLGCTSQQQPRAIEVDLLRNAVLGMYLDW